MRPVWYTDGACSGNGNVDAVGGWAAICIDETTGNLLQVNAGKAQGTTNNRMEMTAIIYALKQGYKDANHLLIIRSDSAYAVNTFNIWMYNWANNNWLKSDNKVPENLDLVKEFYSFITTHDVFFDLQKVKGHSNDKWNNYVDALATGKLTIEQLKQMENIYGETN